MSTQSNQPEDQMLRSEIEIMMADREALLRVAGAAAKFVENMNMTKLPVSSIPLAQAISSAVNALSEDSLRDALESLQRRP